MTNNSLVNPLHTYTVKITFIIVFVSSSSSFILEPFLPE